MVLCNQIRPRNVRNPKQTSKQLQNQEDSDTIKVQTHENYRSNSAQFLGVYSLGICFSEDDNNIEFYSATQRDLQSR